MAIVKRYYKDKLPPKIISLVEWLIIKSNSQSHSRFDDVDGITEYIVFQLTFRKVIVVIDRTNAGYITFRLEASNEQE